MRPTNLRFPSSAGGKKSAAANTTNGTQDGAPNSGSLPMLTLPSTILNNIVAILGEFVGTFLFLFFSFAGTQIANMSVTAVAAANLLETAGKGSPPDPINVMFIALAFGLSLMANVWAFYRVTGGLFNPCVTLALFLIGGLPAVRSFIVVIAQLLGGIAAAGVVSALFPGPLVVDTLLGGGTSISQGLFIEVFLTAELVFVIIMVAVEKHKSTYLAPVAIGVAFFLAELIGVFFTGGSLNPARSLGPAVINASFPGYFWIYWVGPILGALLACGFYILLKWLRWSECNPGQDWNDVEKFESEKKAVNGDEQVPKPDGAPKESGSETAQGATNNES